MRDLGTAVGGQCPSGQNIGFAVLKELEHSTNVVLELLGKNRDILARKHIHEVRGFGRVAPNDFNLRFVFENARNLVAGEENRRTPIVPCHPFH